MNPLPEAKNGPNASNVGPCGLPQLRIAKSLTEDFSLVNRFFCGNWRSPLAVH
jgi:hypothetical protein